MSWLEKPSRFTQLGAENKGGTSSDMHAESLQGGDASPGVVQDGRSAKLAQVISKECVGYETFSKSSDRCSFGTYDLFDEFRG